jgi:hypothetical protein
MVNLGPLEEETSIKTVSERAYTISYCPVTHKNVRRLIALKSKIRRTSQNALIEEPLENYSDKKEKSTIEELLENSSDKEEKTTHKRYNYEDMKNSSWFNSYPAHIDDDQISQSNYLLQIALSFVMCLLAIFLIHCFV